MTFPVSVLVEGEPGVWMRDVGLKKRVLRQMVDDCRVTSDGTIRQVGTGTWHEWSGDSNVFRGFLEPHTGTLDEVQNAAKKRGAAMMMVPMKDLPTLALEFAKHLCADVGMCGEALLTAYTTYAQCVEGLACADDLYKARPQDIEWFKERTK